MAPLRGSAAVRPWRGEDRTPKLMVNETDSGGLAPPKPESPRCPGRCLRARAAVLALALHYSWVALMKPEKHLM